MTLPDESKRDEEPWFSATLWINAHWLSAPMLTDGMAEQAWAIVNGHSDEVISEASNG